jgi:ketosteroid isomerase-like protein
MSQENIELINTIYGLFNARQYDPILPNFAGDMTWIAADSSPLADESPYHGPAHIRERVFGRIEAGFESLTVRIDEIFAADDGRVVVLGYYDSLLKGRETSSQIQLAHIWTVRDGNAVKFQQYVDTHRIAESFKA